MTTAAISRAKLQSKHHHQQTNIQFLQDRSPSCHPTNSVKAVKGNYHIPWTCLPQDDQGGLPTLSMTTNSSWLPLGWVAMTLISPLMPVPQKTTHIQSNHHHQQTNTSLVTAKSTNSVHIHTLTHIDRHLLTPTTDTGRLLHSHTDRHTHTHQYTHNCNLNPLS